MGYQLPKGLGSGFYVRFYHYRKPNRPNSGRVQCRNYEPSASQWSDRVLDQKFSHKEGFASQAARLVTPVGFRQLGLIRVGILRSFGYTADEGVAEKDGRSREGL